MWGGVIMRANAYIDGYNLYFAEVNLQDNRLKWLNIRALCQHFCDEGDFLDKVYYFTALAEYYRDNPQKSYKPEVHKIYMDEFLSGFDVETKLGEFKKQKNYYKEKQTDINLALQLYEDAIYNKFDKAILVTADTDFVAVIKKIRENKQTSDKQIIVLLPHQCNKKNFDGADKVVLLQREHFAGHLLPKYSKNNVMMPECNLIQKQSQEQNSTEISKLAEFGRGIPFPPLEFPPCKKCKDYLDYKSYEQVKNNQI